MMRRGNVIAENPIMLAAVSVVKRRFVLNR
jgi:hypothetical protein